MKKIYLLVMAFALASALFCFGSIFRYEHFEPESLNQWGFGSDSDQYWDLSANLMKRRGFVDSPGFGYQGLGIKNRSFSPDLIRMPGYPVALAIFREISDSVSVAYVFNFLCFGLILFYFSLLSTELLSFNLGSLGAAVFFFGLSPLFFIFNQGVQSDTFVCVLVTAFTYYLLRFRKYEQNLVWVVLFAAAALISKANTLFFIFPVLTLTMMVKGLRSRVKIKLVAVTLVIALPLLIWSSRVYKIAGSFQPAVYSGQNLFLNFVYFEPELPPEFARWQGEGRAVFMKSQTDLGLSVAQSAVSLDRELKSVTLKYCAERRARCFKTALNRVSGLFLTSYFEVADVVFSRLLHINLIENHYLTVDDVQKNGSRSDVLAYKLLRLLNVCFKYSLIFATLILAVLGLKAVFLNQVELDIALLNVGVAIFVIGTGLLATVDRLMLPVYSLVFLNLCYGIKVLLSKFRRYAVKCSDDLHA